MRLVVQRVKNASVKVDGQVHSFIGRGLCVLVGIHKDDTDQDLQQMSRKLLKMRLFASEEGKHWDKSVQDLQLELLCVSQFTLYGNLSKGNKPDFHRSMPADQALPFFNKFLQTLREAYAVERVQEGKFQHLMEVNIVNDGPVTIVLDSRNGE